MTTPPRPPSPEAPREDLHPRNRHRGRYDMPRLVRACPELRPFVISTPTGEPTIDFADPVAVRLLNRALLKEVYGVAHWDLSVGFLCPPIPGRADHLHHLADLLATSNGGVLPRGPKVHVLDVGVGASCIYPILGNREYGWVFLGSDIDREVLAAADAILAGNPGLDEAVDLRLQPSRKRIFDGIVKPGETFHLTLCNPPFHASAAEAREGSQRKWRNLGRDAGPRFRPTLNFGGQKAELWCEGGEAGFIGRMIAESEAFADQCLWFSSLVSRSATLPGLQKALRQLGVADMRILEMTQGQKRSRILAWTFHDLASHPEWFR